MVNFDKYIEIEGLLGKLFAKSDFCIKHCVEKGDLIGCCKQNYFDDFFYELNDDRLKKYGKPNMCKGKCGYHLDSVGCLLKTHKSPICLGYLCTPFEDHLKSLGIEWKGNELIKIMGELINGDYKNYDYIKNKINGFLDLTNL